jgi:alpha-beta hydrolase superfamily lysophospholipase
MTSFAVFRFGLPGHERFGAYHPPAAGLARSEAVLLCNPFGQEAIRAHRLLRILAERLARQGLAVLRFDYFATGDSDGDDAQGTLTDWIDDVIAADRELARRSGAASVSWVGLRLGATLAALASSRASTAPRGLVLWAPVTDGPSYLRELASAHATETKSLHGDPDPARAVAEDPEQALGYPLPPALRAQLRAIAPGDIASCRAARVTLVEEGEFAPGIPITQAFASRGQPADVVRIETRTNWPSDEAMNTSIVPMDGVQAVLAALEGSP